MNFNEGQYYHIFNQGNNKQPIFFSDENYIFFLWKMRMNLLPFGDFIAWCLMPNHYHWLFYVRRVEVQRKLFRDHVDKVEYARRIQKYGEKAISVEHERTRTANQDTFITLNESIGVLQSSYAQAINREQKFSGSLFRDNFKAKDGFIDDFITVEKNNGKLDTRFFGGNNYIPYCIHYIHKNAVVAGLVLKETDWIWSSARDYKGSRKGTLCNRELGRQLLGI